MVGARRTTSGLLRGPEIDLDGDQATGCKKQKCTHVSDDSMAICRTLLVALDCDAAISKISMVEHLRASEYDVQDISVC